VGINQFIALHLTTQPLTWPFLIALAELRWFEETATHDNQLERKIWLIFFVHSSIVTMAMGNNLHFKKCHVVGVVNSEVNKLGVIYGVFIGNFWVGYIR
jgi:hypothetical protein